MMGFTDLLKTEACTETVRMELDELITGKKKEEIKNEGPLGLT